MQDKSSIGLLFDLSFTEFITTRIIKILFVIGVVFSVFWTLIFIVGCFKASAVLGILFLILSPIVFLIWVLFVRVWCEIIIVVFRIAENTSRLVDQGKSKLGES